MPRTVIFAVVTILWLLLGALRFYSVQHAAQQHGSPLEEADVRLAEKLEMVTRAPALKDLAMAAAQRIDLPTVYQRALQRAPHDAALRLRFAVILFVDKRETEAREQLAQADATPETGNLARAVRDAFGVSAAPPRATVLADDVAALRIGLDGWPREAALASLYRRGGDRAAAAATTARMEADATRTASVLTAMAGIAAVNFVLGVVVLVVYLAAGREWNLVATPAPLEAEWDPLKGWGLVVAWQVIALVLSGVAVPILGAAARKPLAVVGVQVILYAVLLALIAWAIEHRWPEAGVHARRWGRCVMVGLAGYWAAFVVLIAVGMLLYAVGKNAPSSNPVFNFLRDLHGPGDLAAMFLLVAVLGPVFEEILFRGVLFTSMKRVMPVWAAVLGSAAVFSLAHGDLNAAGPLFVLGCVLAVIFQRTRSVAASSVTHALWNAQTFAAVLVLFS